MMRFRIYQVYSTAYYIRTGCWHFLPEHRVADMHLTYTDSCPKGWNAPGFKSCTDPKLVIGIPKRPRVEYVNTGHHRYIPTAIVIVSICLTSTVFKLTYSISMLQTNFLPADPTVILVVHSIRRIRFLSSCLRRFLFLTIYPDAAWFLNLPRLMVAILRNLELKLLRVL